MKARIKKYKYSINEDLKILQRKISGRSVYRRINSGYKRKPKHSNFAYLDYA